MSSGSDRGLSVRRRDFLKGLSGLVAGLAAWWFGKRAVAGAVPPTDLQPVAKAAQRVPTHVDHWLRIIGEELQGPGRELRGANVVLCVDRYMGIPLDEVRSPLYQVCMEATTRSGETYNHVNLLAFDADEATVRQVGQIAEGALRRARQKYGGNLGTEWA